MRFTLFLVRRFFLQISTRSSIIVSLVAFFGVFLGVYTLVVVLGVMQGFEHDLKKRILNVQGHIAVFKFQATPIEEPDSIMKKIQTIPNIIVISPFITQEILIVKEKEVTGTLLRGVDPRLERKILHLRKTAINGRFDFNAKSYREVVLGKSLAKRLGAEVGDSVTLASPSLSKMGPLGSAGPRLLRCKVIGTLDLGLYQFNNNLSYVSLKTARKFFRMKKPAISGFSLQIKDPYKAKQKRLILQKKLGGFPYLTSSWEEINSNLFEAIALERLVMFVILILILIMASFSITSSLIIMVLERMRTIGILGAIGVSRHKVQLIFWSIGLLIGILGTTAGLTSGLITGFFFQKYSLLNLPQDIYWIKGTPFSFSIENSIVLLSFTLLLSILAAVIPAWWVSKQDPMKAIRYG